MNYDEIDAKRKAAYARYVAALASGDVGGRKKALAEIEKLHHERVAKEISFLSPITRFTHDEQEKK